MVLHTDGARGRSRGQIRPGDRGSRAAGVDRPEECPSAVDDGLPITGDGQEKE